MKLQLNSDTNNTSVYLSTRQWKGIVDFVVTFLETNPSTKLFIVDRNIDGLYLTYKGPVDECEKLLTSVRNLYYDAEQIDNRFKSIIEML